MSHPQELLRTSRRARLGWIGVVVGAGLASSATAQTKQLRFTLDWHGPTVSQPSVNGAGPITEADVLSPPGLSPAFGPLPPPFLQITGGQIGLVRYPVCVGTAAGSGCGIEVDAFSHGFDARYPNPGAPEPRPRIYFSVDRFALGSAPVFTASSVATEALAREAAADVFVNALPILAPIDPVPGTIGANVAVFDGNGLPSALNQSRTRGVGLIEPHSPTPSTGLDQGDNLDGLDLRAPPPGAGSVYFSLDGGFPDSQLGGPNSNSAQLNGFSPSQVLRRQFSSGSISVYATPSQLGLHPMLDDLDVIVLAENGIEGFQPSQSPFDWNGFGIAAGMGTDMLLYSVRRGSALVGQPDSLFGRAISPGDLLTTPVAGGNGNPAIFVPAESLGLAASRSGAPQNDELDATAILLEPFTDCNGNGVEDAVDIAQGASSDTNANGIPDECEDEWTSFCTCPSTHAPCSNSSAISGCLHSFGVGGVLAASGSTSAAEDDLVLTATNLPTTANTLLFCSQAPALVTFGDGVRCVGGSITRLGIQTASGGVDVRGPGLYGVACAAGACWQSGETWYFQTWFRNAPAYCTAATFNLTNGMQVVFTP